MKKYSILITVITIFASTAIFAEKIDLPDMVTIIEGQTVTIAKDALPYFEDVIERPEGSGDIVPVLPELNIERHYEFINEEEKENEKSLFSEVLLSGGFPFMFRGDCTLYGVTKADPFKITFNFNTANGYAGRKLKDNYFDKNIGLTFKKDYKKNDFNWGFVSKYNAVTNGLQGKVDGISVMNQDYISGKGDFLYTLSDKFSVGATVDLGIYNRYGGISYDKELPEYLKQNFEFILNPVIFANADIYGFDTTLSFNYLSSFINKENISGGHSHRGEFSLSTIWQYDILKAYGSLSLAFGNHFNNNKVTALAPFTLGVETSFPIYFSNRNITLLFEGGLDSYNNFISDTEYKYRFSVLPVVPEETADWYFKLKIGVPIKSTFTAAAFIKYSHTAFNKGVWESNYKTDSVQNGLYNIKQKNQQLLVTDFNVTFHKGIFSVKGGVYSNWLDIPALEDMHVMNISLGFQDEESKWGASIQGRFKVEENWSLPIINLDGYFQLSKSLRLALDIEDLLTGLWGTQRNFRGGYTSRGFTASLYLNFVL